MTLIEIFAAAIVLVFGLLLGWLFARQAQRSSGSETEQIAASLDEAVAMLRSERSELMSSSIDAVLNVASHKLGDQLAVGKEVIDRERDSMTNQVDHVQSELRRVGDLVVSLQKERAEQNGQLSEGLSQALRATATLNDTTQSLRKALASPKSRGQWGERMAEDVLTAAGFKEGINYRKQTKAAGGGIPDYSFDLPKGHLVHMDVKFPIDNYLRWLEADDEATRASLAKAFRNDVRQRVRELSSRSYIDPETTVDYVLLFVPNESVYGFLHEHDPDLIDHTLRQRVVLCSPTTLFAVLAVIRQAVDNFLVERRSDEILAALSGLRSQWDRWEAPLDKMKRGLSSAQRAFDELEGPRKREFERQLEKLEDFREGRSDQQLLTQPQSQTNDDPAKLPGDSVSSSDDDSNQLGVLKSA